MKPELPTEARVLAPRTQHELEEWRAALQSLSSRQLETLKLLATGLPAHRIAVQLGVSEATIKSHIQHVYRKLGVSNRVEASMRFLQAGLDLPPR